MTAFLTQLLEKNVLTPTSQTNNDSFVDLGISALSWHKLVIIPANHLNLDFL